MFFIARTFLLEKKNINTNKFISFSIIIPARNEENNIEKCIHSVLNCNYPKEYFEILLIDDNSEDKTLELLSVFKEKITIINLSGTGKKKAIEIGVKKSKYDYIITLDADCTVNKDWMHNWSNHISEERPTISTGMVTINNHTTILSNFESIDTINLMAVSNFGIKKQLFCLGNGANLAFKKDFYLRAKSGENYASGDDVFLLKKAKDINEKITFNNHLNSSVFTPAQPDFITLLSQRKRWATKTKGYANSNLLLTQGLVFLVNVIVPLLIVINLFFFCFCLFQLSCLFILLKLLIDYTYLSFLSKQINSKQINKFFLSSYVLNIFIYLFMSYQAVIPSKYNWKNRTVN